MTTTAPPLSSGAHTSRVLASNAGFEAKATRSWAVNLAKPLLMTKRTMARWGTCTPFAAPVEPEVYIT
ncbi:syringopeptin synthetase domain protein [Pseudomonas putida S610]|nr:syringopeptin synthetase domain protein [Pseudomonas putida S610]